MIEVEWDREQDRQLRRRRRAKALDRTRLGVDVVEGHSDHHLNILRSETLTGADRVSRMRFEFELADPAHLDSLLSALKRIDSIYDAYRVLPGRGG